MKPADHPEFFRLPPPEGRSRESGIVLDREGRFFHHGAPVEHPGMARAFASWIDRHPDDGRYILNNGYDWSYFTVEDAPFLVTAVRVEEPASAEAAGEPASRSAAAIPMLELSDGTRERLDPGALERGEGDALYVRVKARFRARFTQFAQLGLAPWIEQTPDGRVCVRVGHSIWVLGDA